MYRRYSPAAGGQQKTLVTHVPGPLFSLLYFGLLRTRIAGFMETLFEEKDGRARCLGWACFREGTTILVTWRLFIISSTPASTTVAFSPNRLIDFVLQCESHSPKNRVQWWTRTTYLRYTTCAEVNSISHLFTLIITALCGRQYGCTRDR